MLRSLLEIYLNAIDEFTLSIANVEKEAYEEIKDRATEDMDCRSIKTVTIHVIQSGYTYSNYVNQKSNLKWIEYTRHINTSNEGIEELVKLKRFISESFQIASLLPMDTITSWRFDTRWGQSYNFEQLMSHAIVHVLRHKRQIENFD